MSHMCPFNGCHEAIPSELFACLTHWRQMDRGQQREARSLYDQWRRGEISAIELRDGQQAIIDAVQTPPRRKRP